MGGRVEVEGGAPDEGRGEAPGEADEEEAEGPVEDRGGRGVGVGHCWGGLVGRGMGWGVGLHGSRSCLSPSDLPRSLSPFGLAC